MKHILNDISRSELERAIDEWILNQRDREMLKRRLVDGKTYESVKAASRVIGGSASSLSRALIEGRSFKGHECKYI